MHFFFFLWFGWIGPLSLRKPGWASRHRFPLQVPLSEKKGGRRPAYILQIAAAVTLCPWMEDKIKKQIRYRPICVLWAKTMSTPPTPWLADECDREVEVVSAEQKMGGLVVHVTSDRLGAWPRVLPGFNGAGMGTSWIKKDAGNRYGTASPLPFVVCYTGELEPPDLPCSFSN